ncbi:MAG: tRNA uridine-5-carboxymethylaminomethyl(34) synthesis enzyme MnmG, partial [Alphaproteobacteria bacterium]
SEPYRMFTSRAEFRLSLRADNADLRLTDLGIELGCVSERRSIRFRAKRDAIQSTVASLKARHLTPNEAASHGIALNHDGIRRDGFELLAFPSLDWTTLARVWPELSSVPNAIAQQVEIDAKYSVYLHRQSVEVEAHRRDEALKLPETLDFDHVPGLSNEIRMRLKASRPQTLGQASRLDGMTPSALTVIAVWARRSAANHAA